MTLTRTAAVIALATLVFGAAYLLSSSAGENARAPSGTLRKLSYPAPAVALPAAEPSGLPSLAPAPRPTRRSRSGAAPPRPAAPVPAAPAPAPPARPPPAPPPGGGGIIEG